ncbi:MAG TPA: hypothetical protein VFN73_03100 [Propionibacteriaceae bacterium]|nr:hypothetical protein [Propionibacteriaceae bacterium]
MNPGEDLFVSYLENRGLSYEPEPLIGGRKPDFLVQVRGVEVACEVYEPEIYLPRRQSPDGRSAPLGGFMDPYTRLRRGFEARKQDQIKAFSAAGYPVLLVFAETASEIPLDPVTMAGAMYGNLQVSFPVGEDSTEKPPAQMGFGGGGRVQARRRRGLSAVAILKCFNPGMWQVEQTIDGRLRDAGFDRSLASTKRAGEAAEIICAVYAEARADGWDDNERATRLEVIHNPYAVHTLNLDCVGGPWDSQWAAIRSGPAAVHALVAEGVLGYQRPGREPLLYET